MPTLERMQLLDDAADLPRGPLDGPDSPGNQLLRIGGQAAAAMTVLAGCGPTTSEPTPTAAPVLDSTPTLISALEPSPTATPVPLPPSEPCPSEKTPYKVIEGDVLYSVCGRQSLVSLKGCLLWTTFANLEDPEVPGDPVGDMIIPNEIICLPGLGFNSGVVIEGVSGGGGVSVDPGAEPILGTRPEIPREITDENDKIGEKEVIHDIRDITTQVERGGLLTIVGPDEWIDIDPGDTGGWNTFVCGASRIIPGVQEVDFATAFGAFSSHHEENGEWPKVPLYTCGFLIENYPSDYETIRGCVAGYFRDNPECGDQGPAYHVGEMFACVRDYNFRVRNIYELVYAWELQINFDRYMETMRANFTAFTVAPDDTGRIDPAPRCVVGID